MPSTNAPAHSWTEVVLPIGPGNLLSAVRKLARSESMSWIIGVLMNPMCAEPTSTPRWATSSASAFAKCSTPAFDTQYEAAPGLRGVSEHRRHDQHVAAPLDYR